MLDRNYRDVVAGFALTLSGLASALYAMSSYSMGTITRMGPGMMPVLLGLILAVFGLAIAIPAFFQKGEGVIFRTRALIFLSASVLCFALMIETFGMLPSVFATTVVATLAETKISLVRAVILGASMALLTWAVFIAGLRLNIPSAAWPF